ncbi:MAG: ABC transporter substrate-binding protein [Hyphomicrobiales bacterium]
MTHIQLLEANRTGPFKRTLTRIGRIVWLAAFIVVGSYPVQAASDEARVISIGGAITEIIFALEEQDRLVARDSTSTFPQDAVALPDIGYMRAISPENVLALKPGLIIANAGSGPPEAIQVLKQASITFVEIPERFDQKGVDDAIRIVADALGVPAKGDALRADVARQFSDISKVAEQVDEAESVLFILSMQSGRILAAGTNTAANGIIDLAGGKNAIQDLEGYKPLNEEAIITANPDVVLMMDRSGDHAIVADELFAHPAILATNAGKSKKLIRMNGLYLLGFGPRTAAAARELAAHLYQTSGQ